MSAGVKNRWWTVVGAILIQLGLGAIYAWSVFTPNLVEAGWTKTQSQQVFSAGLVFFALAMVLAGQLLPKLGPRVLAITGAAILGGGYLLAGLVGGTSFPAILLLVGVVGGSGIGLAYVIPIAVGMKWFPDKKGLVTGLAVAGFGFGALFWVKLAGSWGGLLESIGLSLTLAWYGVIFLVIVLIGSIWMVFPPDGWKPEGWTPPEPTHGSMNSVDLRPGRIIRTVQFYQIFIAFVFSAGAGLMCIGLMKLFPMAALQAKGMGYEDASAVSEFAMAVCFALANGVGRILWGKISDNIGPKHSIVIMTAMQGVLVILFQWMAGIPALLYIAATLIGFNFGGNFALFPTITAGTFGTKSIGQNYPLVFLAYGVGGLLGPIMGGKLGDMGNFPLAFTIVGILVLAASGLMMSLGTPKAQES